jgi:hypothetical protein
MDTGLPSRRFLITVAMGVYLLVGLLPSGVGTIKSAIRANFIEDLPEFGGERVTNC